MFPLRIIHERHGAMHVYNEDELKKHQEWGWAAEAPETIECAQAADAKPDAPKKRGRKPKVAA